MSINSIGYENVGGEDALLRVQLPFARRASGPKKRTAKALAKAYSEFKKRVLKYALNQHRKWFSECVIEIKIKNE